MTLCFDLKPYWWEEKRSQASANPVTWKHTMDSIRRDTEFIRELNVQIRNNMKILCIHLVSLVNHVNIMKDISKGRNMEHLGDISKRCYFVVK